MRRLAALLFLVVASSAALDATLCGHWVGDSAWISDSDSGIDRVVIAPDAVQLDQMTEGVDIRAIVAAVDQPAPVHRVRKSPWKIAVSAALAYGLAKWLA